MASEYLFCDVWIRTTIRKVMMAVQVLVTTYQISEKWKKGHVAIQTSTIKKALIKAVVLPAALVPLGAKSLKELFFLRVVSLFIFDNLGL